MILVTDLLAEHRTLINCQNVLQKKKIKKIKFLVSGL